MDERSHVHRIREILSRVKLQHAVFNRLDFDAEMVTPLGLHVAIRIYARVPDRQLPEDPGGHDVPEIPTYLEIRLTAEDLLCSSDDAKCALAFAHRVRDVLQKACEHEIDEMLIVNGRREFNPHPGEDEPPPAEVFASRFGTGIRFASIYTPENQEKLRASYARDRRARIGRRTP